MEILLDGVVGNMGIMKPLGSHVSLAFEVFPAAAPR
jgi:hypothetical protein